MTVIDLKPPTAALWQLYADHHWDTLSDDLLAYLDKLQPEALMTLGEHGQQDIDAFVNLLCTLLCQEDYDLSPEATTRFIRHNALISNLAAISSWKTTDVWLRMMSNQQDNLARFLILYSARNTDWVERQGLFDSNPSLASLWYTSYMGLYNSGIAERYVHENLKRHLQYIDPRMTSLQNPHHLYFGSSYIDPELDRPVKEHVNRILGLIGQQLQVTSYPLPDSIAVVTNRWMVGHSVWRNQYPFLKALAEHYTLTLVHLGPVTDRVDVSLFKHVYEVGLKEGGELHMPQAVLQNDFALAYFPDVGMCTESILLANMRLAPVQVTSYGHSVSTFGAAMDYWLGGADVEIEPDLEKNYSEKVVLMPGLGIANVPPSYTRKGKQQRDARLQGRVIVNCSWFPQKVNAELLSWLSEIQKRSVEAKPFFRFFSAGGLLEHQNFIPFLITLNSVLGQDNFECLSLPYEDYMTKMEEGDLCLDSYPHGGCNTVVDALHLRLPIVTLEGKLWRNRIGAAILRKAFGERPEIGLMAMITPRPQVFIDTAVGLIIDSDWRNKLTCKIARAGLTIDRNLYNLQEDGDNFVRTIQAILGEQTVIEKMREVQKVRYSEVCDPVVFPKDTSTNLYLDLLERTLCGLIYCDGFTDWNNRAEESPFYDAGEGIVQSFNYKRRVNGQDWPTQAHTMIGLKRLHHLQTAIRDVIGRDIPGDFIECGVWRGGACIYMRAVLQALGITDRKVYVADSFQGLPEPTHLEDADDKHYTFPELAVSMNDVKTYFYRYGFPVPEDDQVVFVPGWFHESLETVKGPLAILRIDADMYSSTRDCLNWLYNSVSEGGIVIIDDYHTVPACRTAVDEFRTKHGITAPLEKIDASGVFWRKGGPAMFGETVESMAVATDDAVNGRTMPLRDAAVEHWREYADEVDGKGSKLLPVHEDIFHRPLFTVIIPVYNRTQYLKKCIESVLASGFGPEQLEIIIADDSGNNRESAAIEILVQELQRQRGGYITHLMWKTSLGLWRNVNAALRRSTGQWIHLLCDDDWVSGDFYKKIKDAMWDAPKVGAICCNFNIVGDFYPPSNPRHKTISETSGILPNWLPIIAKDNHLQACAVVIRREVFETLGVWREDIPYTADWEMYIRCASKYQWWCVAESLAFYRKHGSNYSLDLWQSGQARIDTDKTLAIGEKEVRKRMLQESNECLAKATAPRPTLMDLCVKHRCDKWRHEHEPHGHLYAPHYEAHFGPLRDKPIHLLEIGIGGYQDPNAGGNSLRMWREWFSHPKAVIAGLDIEDKRCSLARDCILFKGSQTDNAVLRRIKDNLGGLDLVVDDGSHLSKDVIATFQYLFPLLNNGGIYAVEDVSTSYWREYGGGKPGVSFENQTTMGFFQLLTHKLNWEEWYNDCTSQAIEAETTDYYARYTVAIHFYHNLIIIYKGNNNEGSNQKYVRQKAAVKS